MSWERQKQTGSPERQLQDKERRERGIISQEDWEDAYLDVSLRKVKELLSNTPELRRKLNGLSPNNRRSIESLASELGLDEVYLAAVAFALRQHLIGTE